MIVGDKVVTQSGKPGRVKVLKEIEDVIIAEVVTNCNNNWEAYQAYVAIPYRVDNLKRGWPKDVPVTKKLSFDDWCNKYEELARERIDYNLHTSGVEDFNYELELQREFHKYLSK